MFDNPYENGAPTAQMQIVIHGGLFAGTYTWSPADSAYEADVGGTRYFVYMDSVGVWTLADALSQSTGSLGRKINSTDPRFRALPPTSGAGWSPSSVLSSIDVSVGGVSAALKAPDTTVTTGDVLQVTFENSFPGGGATYQWQSSTYLNSSFQDLPVTTGTYTIVPNDTSKWIRVLVTPTDSSGQPTGTPVASQAVHPG